MILTMRLFSTIFVKHVKYYIKLFYYVLYVFLGLFKSFNCNK